jgi:hypothetical protein
VIDDAVADGVLGIRSSADAVDDDDLDALELKKVE